MDAALRYLEWNRFPAGYLDTVSLLAPPRTPFSSEWSILLMSETVAVLQAPLGSLEKEKFPEWTTISSAWGNSVSWMKVGCYWRAAHMMVRVGADIPATPEVRQHGVLFQHQHQNQCAVVTLRGMESWKPHEYAPP